MPGSAAGYLRHGSYINMTIRRPGEFKAGGIPKHLRDGWQGGNGIDRRVPTSGNRPLLPANCAPERITAGLTAAKRPTKAGSILQNR